MRRKPKCPDDCDVCNCDALAEERRDRLIDMSNEEAEHLADMAADREQQAREAWWG